METEVEIEASETSDELRDLVRLILLVLEANKVASISCETSSKARNLRRKFYRLGERLEGEEQKLFSRVTFRLIGHHVLLEPKANTSWQQAVTLGVPTDVPTASGELPPSNRLDDSK